MKKSSYREPDPFPSNLVALLERIVCVKYFGLFCFLMKREFKGTLKIISKRLLLLQLAVKSGTKHNNILMAICKAFCNLSESLSLFLPRLEHEKS